MISSIESVPNRRESEVLRTLLSFKWKKKFSCNGTRQWYEPQKHIGYIQESLKYFWRQPSFNAPKFLKGIIIIKLYVATVSISNTWNRISGSIEPNKFFPVCICGYHSNRIYLRSSVIHLLDLSKTVITCLHVPSRRLIYTSYYICWQIHQGYGSVMMHNWSWICTAGDLEVLRFSINKCRITDITESENLSSTGYLIKTWAFWGRVNKLE